MSRRFRLLLATFVATAFVYFFWTMPWLPRDYVQTVNQTPAMKFASIACWVYVWAVSLRLLHIFNTGHRVLSIRESRS